MKILVTQYYTDNLLYAELSEKLNRQYCEKNSYSYFVEKNSDKIKSFCIEEDIAIQWYKVKYVYELLKNNPDQDYILFLDADAIVSNLEKKIEEYVDEKYNLVFANDIGSHSVVNTGVFLVKNNNWSVEFFGKWWASRNEISGQDVKDVLNWDGGMHRPELKSVFRSSLWHEQTCISYLYNTQENIKEHIKILESEDFNSPIYRPDGFIFHAFAYGFTPYRNLDLIYEARTAVNTNKKKINIVYFIYCIGDYLQIAKKDLNRIIESGLYADSSNIHIVASLPDSNPDKAYNDLIDLYKGKDKVTFHKHYQNIYEHYGICRAWIEAHKFDGYILYFHAKGVANKATNNNEHSSWKREGDSSFIEMLKYFMIDRYKDNISKLEEYDQVNVCDSYSRGWPSGNFWWCKAEYLRTANFPYESTWDRWASEAWLNFRSKRYSTFQVYDRFYFRDKFTSIPENSYKTPGVLADKKVILDYAKLVTLMEPENENDINRPNTDNAVDFTDFVQKNLEDNDYKGFKDIIVSFTTMGRTIPDPLYGTLKSLVIAFYVEGDPTQYRLVGDEGSNITFRIDSYNSIGYDFEYPDKVVREIIKK
jgi:hypothetical protein